MAESTESTVKQQVDTVANGLMGMFGMLQDQQKNIQQQIDAATSSKFAKIENAIAGLRGALGACEVKKIACAVTANSDGKAHYYCKMAAGIAGPLTVAVKQNGVVTEYQVERGNKENPAFANVGETSLDLVFDKAPESVEVIDAGSVSIIDRVKTHWTAILQIGEKLKELYELISKLVADQASTQSIVDQISSNQIQTAAGSESQIQALVEGGEVMRQDLKKLKSVMLGIAKAIGD